MSHTTLHMITELLYIYIYMLYILPRSCPPFRVSYIPPPHHHSLFFTFGEEKYVWYFTLESLPTISFLGFLPLFVSNKRS